MGRLHEFCKDNDVVAKLQGVLTIMGFENEDSLEQWLRCAPSVSSLRVNTLMTSADELISKVSPLLIERYGTMEITKHSTFNDIVFLRGGYKAKFEGNIVGDVIIRPKCASTVLRGADIFIPGIMLAPRHLKAGDYVNVIVDIEEKGLKGGDSCDYQSDLKVKIGIGRALLSRAELFKGEVKTGVGIEMMDIPLPSFHVLDHLRNGFYPQNYPSILTVHVLDPRPNENILDMCASPGGKTSHIGTLMNNTGVVVAVDKSKPKIEAICQTCLRLGVKNVSTVIADASKLLETPDFCAQYGPLFDRILVDAPCSALGQRAQFKCELRLKEMESFPNLQRKILRTGFKLLKPGGKLVYSTCTITTQENEDMVEWILQTFDSVTLDKTDKNLDNKGMKRFSDSDNIGFFISSFYKIE